MNPHNPQKSSSLKSSSLKSSQKKYFLIIPITSFCLGIWQMKRLKWKNNLIEEREKQYVIK